MSRAPARRELDLCGIPCPLSWARAKVLLEELQPGDVLTVLTDDPRAVRDMPGAAEIEGYMIVEVETSPTGTRIRIER